MNLGLLFEIYGISLKLGLVVLHLGFLLGVDDDGRLGHIVVMFMLFDLVMFMFFFPCRFDVHILRCSCSFILGLLFDSGFDVVARFDLHVL